MKLSHIKRLLLIIFCLVIGLLRPLTAGPFSAAKSLEISAEKISHTFAKDEIRFTLTGKCQGLFVLAPELTLELKYPSATKELFATQMAWGYGMPLVIKIPDGLSDLQSFRLKGKSKGVVKPTHKHTGDVEKDFEVMDDYRSTIDTEWKK